MAQRLDGPEQLELQQLLQAAVPSWNDLRQLLQSLDRRLEDYYGPFDAYPDALGRVVAAANAKLWWRTLVRAARAAVPEDAELEAFDKRYEALPRVSEPGGPRLDPVPGGQFELKIRATGTLFDIGPWLLHASETSDRVCRVEYPERTDRGTGFLVGPGAVLTNYHVIKPILKKPELVPAVALRFDYKVSDAGVAVEDGVVYRLDESGWLAYDSEYSDVDEQLEPPIDAPADKLDFAILRVKGTPGTDPVGGDPSDDERPRRGWIEAPIQDYDFTGSPSLYIVQHPDGKPMQIALDTQAVLGLNGNGTRVRYRTTTEPGSSGAPCFGPNWEWVAVHHMGDPKYNHGVKPEFNQGIPVTAIRSLLASEGKLTLLGGGAP